MFVHGMLQHLPQTLAIINNWMFVYASGGTSKDWVKAIIFDSRGSVVWSIHLLKLASNKQHGLSARNNSSRTQEASL